MALRLFTGLVSADSTWVALTWSRVDMDVSELLIELYERIPPLAQAAVDGLDSEQLAQSPSTGANTIGWLVWHLARVQDHHLAEVLDTEQLWVLGEWAGACGLEPDPSNIGYGHTATEMAAVQPAGADVLTSYLGAVHERSIEFLRSLSPADLDRIVDQRWDPPVTLGVRLVSVADDSLQHVGQAAYVRGLFDL